MARESWYSWYICMGHIYKTLLVQGTGIIWVPSHLEIYRNEIADKLAKMGHSRRKIQSSYASLSYRGRIARENILK